VKEKAVMLFALIEHYGYDKAYEGYFEAFTREWEQLGDQRLSAKDANEKKTMNTHLHILEAYTNLYRIWPDDSLRRQITRLINVFLDHIIHPQTNHLQLFFDEQWNSKSTVISFGHDIEASWLLAEAADIVSDQELIIRAKKRCLLMAYAAARGLDEDGGLLYEQDGGTGQWVREKHWWPQAEAMVGFFHGWQVSGDHSLLDNILRNWTFIKDHLIDRQYGEWYWGVIIESSDKGNTIMSWEDKAGLWKCPYHNGRACMELMRRIDGMMVT
jgi:mannobiose 2-epimerase